MKNLWTLILILSLAGTLAAETYTIQIQDEDVSSVVYSGETVDSFELNLPEGVDRQTFLSATLSLSMSPDETEDGVAEVLVAQWYHGAPIVPERKERPVSAVIMGMEDARVDLDITPIIEEALDHSESSLDLVVGAVAEDVLGDCSILPLYGAGDVWAEVTLEAKKKVVE